MHTKVENAKEMAHNYRDKCNELKKDVMQMKARNDQLQLHVQAVEERQKYDIFGIIRYWKDSQEVGLSSKCIEHRIINN